MNRAVLSARNRVNTLYTKQQWVYQPFRASKTCVRSRFQACSAAAAQPLVVPRSIQMDNLAGFIERVKECNVGLEEVPTFTPFMVDGKKIGLVKPRCVCSHGA